MLSQPTPIRSLSKVPVRYGVENRRKFASIDIVIPSVAERIAHRWAEGALELHLSIEYRTRRAFIEAVLRHQYRKLRAENIALRMERAA